MVYTKKLACAPPLPAPPPADATPHPGAAAAYCLLPAAAAAALWKVLGSSSDGLGGLLVCFGVAFGDLLGKPSGRP